MPNFLDSVFEPSAYAPVDAQRAVLVADLVKGVVAVLAVLGYTFVLQALAQHDTVAAKVGLVCCGASMPVSLVLAFKLLPRAVRESVLQRARTRV
jgi:hypothetical protein